MKTYKENVFSGGNSLNDFLHPNNEMPTALVELPASINMFVADGVRIFAKTSFLAPLFNIKQIAALNLLETAKSEGRLDGVHTLVESSSGNMALGLAVLAPQFGIQKVVAVVQRDLAPGKLEILRLFGVDIEFSDTEKTGVSGIDKAKGLGSRDGWLNLAQYENDANPSSYEKYLAPQIWDQTDGEITVFCAGLGTTGTLIGSSRFFRKQSSNVSIVGVLPEHDSVPGVRSSTRLKEVSFDWASVPDVTIKANTKNSFKKSLEMCRVGILAGPSSGMALSGLLEFIETHKKSGTLDDIRNSNNEVVAVFVSPDSALPYLEKYSTHLDSEDFVTVNR